MDGVFMKNLIISEDGEKTKPDVSFSKLEEPMQMPRI
ncbi:hypothetical protein MCERE19_00193 [Spirosomataceae bacterium]|jgi:hypothetical protein